MYLGEDNIRYVTTTQGFLIRAGEYAAKQNVKIFNKYETEDISFMHMKYLFMKLNDIEELETSKLMAWMESLGWRIHERDNSLRDGKRYRNISVLESIYGYKKVKKSNPLGNL